MGRPRYNSPLNSMSLEEKKEFARNRAREYRITHKEHISAIMRDWYARKRCEVLEKAKIKYQEKKLATKKLV